jgi:hypothetical protein
MDTLKGVALVATFLGFIAVFAVWCSIWNKTWQAAVTPIREEIYSASLPPSHCLMHSWWWWRDAGCRLI